MKKKIVLTLFLPALLCVMAGAINPQTSPLRSLVFDKNEWGSQFYRIPALVMAKDGSLLAVADRRIDNQLDLPGKIDVVAKRSTDGGRTWSEPIMIAEHDSIGGYGDAAVVVERRSGDILAISSHGNGLWQETPAHISVSRSKDNGKTWLKAVDINDQIWKSLPDSIQNYTSWFASSGRAFQTKKGRILFALVTRKRGVNGFPVYAVYSDDGGYNWKVSKTPATLNGDEAKIIELNDGRLLMSIRNRFKGGRIFSYSKDGGVTWGDEHEVDQLPDPACNGDIIRYKRDGHDLLLQTLPGSPTKRDDVTVYVSADDGKTWVHSHRVVRAPSAYSSMEVLGDGNVGFFVEEEVAETTNIDPELARTHPGMVHPGFRLWFTSLPINEILR